MPPWAFSEDTQASTPGTLVENWAPIAPDASARSAMVMGALPELDPVLPDDEPQAATRVAEATISVTAPSTRLRRSPQNERSSTIRHLPLVTPCDVGPGPCTHDLAHGEFPDRFVQHDTSSGRTQDDLKVASREHLK